MKLPTDRKYTPSHEWVLAEGDVFVVGITDNAQEQLGDLVYVGDVQVGAQLKAGDTAGVVESVKAASDVYSPITGTVVEVNSALSDKPETINEDAYGDGWIYVVEVAGLDEVNDLLGPDDYADLLENEDH
ncbi:MAG TPA: glycine cleavage system protein GcvH [Advenella kashmirensis]|uniref:Glycine cleavage system H protein n=1 Tax=Advenella kashmirensis TaxID=310575 RepID=A0A356LK69_9BURK|nr:glycine cleavage system protein GcvH [Advenella kashmirensis]